MLRIINKDNKMLLAQSVENIGTSKRIKKEIHQIDRADSDRWCFVSL